MRIKQSPARTDGTWVGLALLGLGVLIGALLHPFDWLARDDGRGALEPTPAVRNLEAYLRPAASPAPPTENGLRTLAFSLDAEAAGRLQAVRERALARGMIVQAEEDTVPARVALGGLQLDGTVRIKGDWTDHVTSDQWSLRVQLEGGKLLGMSTFSIQHPRTRGWLWEWVVLAAARREGLLAPRSTFVNVTINGNPTGIYYLEEHFSKELLESQGRREGPIVIWDENTRWATLLQARNVPTKDVNLPVPETSRAIWGLAPSYVRGYKEGRLDSSDALARSFYSAVEQMRQVQALVISSSTSRDRFARLEALERLQGESVDTLLAVNRLARMHALASLFQLDHPLVWHNMRFYHDPVLDRLEPILFDVNADHPGSREPVVFQNKPVIQEFSRSRRYYDGVFEDLGDFVRAGYLDELLAELQPELGMYERALDERYTLESRFTVAGMVQRLRTQQAYLRTVVYPVDPINLHASYSLTETEGENLVAGEVYVDCWSTSRTPVVVEGFEFSNGVRVPAAGLVVDNAGAVRVLDGGGVVLPPEIRTVSFRFPMDDRLANLTNVGQVLAAARAEVELKPALDLDIDILYRPIAATEVQAERLRLRRVEPAWRLEQGRPKAPTLQEALEKHDFLEYRPESDGLTIRPGAWEVDGDLIVPSGYTLTSKSAARLMFDEDAVLLSDSPLIWRNLTLEPKQGLERWRGIVVLGANGRSEWNGVIVRRTDAVARGGWIVTGGITFYHSPVTMRDCLIDGTLAEDGTNIFGCDFLMERVKFQACVSDSFDGDFVTGTVRDCVFTLGLADGVDFSGSNVTVENCQFLKMGDKGISAGENSEVHVIGGLCDEVSIGIASKDRSRVFAEGMTIRNARNYALTVFVKKPEFGPARLEASGLTIENSGLGDLLVQTDSELLFDGVAQPTQDLDVKRLYEEKILGQ